MNKKIIQHYLIFKLNYYLEFVLVVQNITPGRMEIYLWFI